MSAQSRAYGFGSWYGGSASDQQMRVSDAERQAVADRLATHFTDGRLDQAEFDERVTRAMGAKTRADLAGLFADLPEAALSGPQDPQHTPSAPPYRHRHPVLLVVLAVVIIMAAAHAVFAGPWLWLGLAVAAVLLVTRGTRHARCSQDRERA